VLLVCANATVSQTLAAQWTYWGCAVEEVPDGVRALDQISADPARIGFDLIVLDDHMPGLGGIDLGRAIRRLAGGREVPILFLSPIASRPSSTATQSIGISAVVSKPVRRSRLWNATLQAGITSDKESVTSSKASRPLPVDQARLELRILVAEDNPVNSLVIRRRLETWACQVVAVTNGADVLKQMGKEPFDAILMDVQMPEMDGFEATAKVREMEAVSGRHTPILALTAHAMDGYRERCLDAGMDDYLSKPIDPAELLQKLLQWT